MEDDRYSNYNEYTDVKRFFGMVLMIVAALWIVLCGACVVALTAVVLSKDLSAAGAAAGGWLFGLTAIGGGIGVFIAGRGMWRQD